MQLLNMKIKYKIKKSQKIKNKEIIKDKVLYLYLKKSKVLI
jgi:hypothetical protein